MRKHLICYLIIANCFAGYGQSLSTGFHSATTFSNDSSLGTISWNIPNNAASPDNSYTSAYALALGNVTHYLTATDFSFSIPSGAIITGIESRIERSSSGILENITDNSVMLIKNGAMAGSNNAANDTWPNSDTTKVYGGNNDLWGTNWTTADINAGNFGIAVSATLNGISVLPHAKIDYIEINVFYTVLTPLPVKLIHFSAEESFNGVLLKWQTATEENNDYFSVERSLDGNKFSELAKIKGAGNSPTILQYNYCDNNCKNGYKYYYRLKQVDYNGAYSYSNIICGPAKDHFTNGSLYTVSNNKIIITRTERKNMNIKIFNIHGQLIHQTTATEIPINILPKGILLLEISDYSDAKFFKFFNQ